MRDIDDEARTAPDRRAPRRGCRRRAHLETFTFEDIGERTKLTTTLLFDTTEERDGLFKQGAEQGWNQTYARLDALLEKLAAR